MTEFRDSFVCPAHSAACCESNTTSCLYFHTAGKICEQMSENKEPSHRGETVSCASLLLKKKVSVTSDPVKDDLRVKMRLPHCQ